MLQWHWEGLISYNEQALTLQEQMKIEKKGNPGMENVYSYVFLCIKFPGFYNRSKNLTKYKVKLFIASSYLVNLTGKLGIK